MHKILGYVLVSLLFVPLAKADDQQFPDNAKRPVIEAAKEVVNSWEDARFQETSQKSLDHLVKFSIATLRDKGFNQEADQFEHEWNYQVALNFGAFGAMNLGDHKPISEWLAKFYNQIEGKLSYKLCHLLHIDDIKIFNYGIPVATHPNGNQGDSWDMVEYSKHFVPLTGAIVYWSVDAACMSIAGLTSYLCRIGDIFLRKAVEKYVAPELSDYVYKKAHGENVQAPAFDYNGIFKELR